MTCGRCLLGFLLFLAVGGCTRAQICESIYESLQRREQAINSPHDPIPAPYPSYDQYQRERNEVLKENEG